MPEALVMFDLSVGDDIRTYRHVEHFHLCTMCRIQNTDYMLFIQVIGCRSDIKVNKFMVMIQKKTKRKKLSIEK